MHSFSLLFSTIIFLLSGSILGLADASNDVSTARNLAVMSSRDTNTCADPAVAETVFQAFIVQTALHGLNFHPNFEHANTANRALIAADQKPTFLAWPTQQNFTVPLFKLSTSDRAHYVYRTGTDAQTPPVVSGFSTDPTVIAWVYNSQVCGSVPLMSAVFTSVPDRYYTTSSFEHDTLISLGWADNGVIAFVLPVYDS